ncbi:NUDIX domain-containing protein [uncultured Brevibacillus sp.]|uniref:NUDIX domain-containing protein n=1 Tax=uncultured Brevibacillus sp. TaxID=169970 RepID=UPI002597487D|nr:NUDIX hydrolase [uncultured Brevibacillus sp.]
MKTISIRVTVVVEHQGRILLIREKTGGEPCYSLPGGNVEYVETIPEATRREVWEETGLLVSMERLLWVDDRISHSGEGKHTIAVAVLAKLMGEETEPIPGGLDDEEIEWAGWVSLDDWRTLPLYHDAWRELVISALANPGYKAEYLGNMLDGKKK